MTATIEAPAAPTEATATPRPKAPKPKKVDEPRPIGDIIDEFLETLRDHPDASLLVGSRGKTPSRSESMTHVPLSLQRLLILKVVYREK